MADEFDDAVQTIGWDAINDALRPIYGEQEPKHYGTLIEYFMGGNDPLAGVSVYKRTEPVPHWHYVSYGLSELYEKSSDDPDVSGYGFEFTFRLACNPDEEEPPAWAMDLMQNLARYVFQTGNVFASGHWVNLNGPIMLGADTQICSVAFVTDPELPKMDTPHGTVEFLQIVGLTQEEEDVGKQWTALNILAQLSPYMPLYITDIARTSLLDREGVREAIAQGIMQEGSSTGQLYTKVLSWAYKKQFLKKPIMQLETGANQIIEMLALLPGRLPHEKDFTLIGPGNYVHFVSGNENRIEEDGIALTISLTEAGLASLLQQVKPLAGTYDIPGMNLQIIVSKTNIRDKDDNIVDVIG